jgi:elongation factor G
MSSKFETISRSAEHRYTYSRILGGAGEFATVSIRTDPLPRGSGVQFLDASTGGSVPKRFVEGVKQGIVEAATTTGVIGGSQITDLLVTLVDGAYHEVDSSPHAFSLAAQAAFREAVRKAGPILI